MPFSFVLEIKMSTTILTPYRGAVAVTKSDATIIPVTRGLYVGVAGDVVVRTVNGDTVTFKAAPVGVLAVAVDQVRAATAATDILALY
jgi:hypothetical protein